MSAAEVSGAARGGGAGNRGLVTRRCSHAGAEAPQARARPVPPPTRRPRVAPFSAPCLGRLASSRRLRSAPIYVTEGRRPAAREKSQDRDDQGLRAGRRGAAGDQSPLLFPSLCAIAPNSAPWLNERLSLSSSLPVICRPQVGSRDLTSGGSRAAGDPAHPTVRGCGFSLSLRVPLELRSRPAQDEENRRKTLPRRKWLPPELSLAGAAGDCYCLWHPEGIFFLPFYVLLSLLHE